MCDENMSYLQNRSIIIAIKVSILWDIYGYTAEILSSEWLSGCDHGLNIYI
jgi:hypothetical protein